MALDGNERFKWQYSWRVEKTQPRPSVLITVLFNKYYKINVKGEFIYCYFFCKNMYILHNITTLVDHGARPAKSFRSWGILRAP